MMRHEVPSMHWRTGGHGGPSTYYIPSYIGGRYISTPATGRSQRITPATSVVYNTLCLHSVLALVARSFRARRRRGGWVGWGNLLPR